jgi:periplasmic divalent cation tolerance protein
MWQGRIRKANEVLVMLKTKAALFGDIVREVQRLHSYELPEVIAVPISKGNKGYLSWIDSNVR